MRGLLFILLLFIFSCSHSIPVQPPPPQLSFCDQVLQDESISCAQLLLHDDGAPTPDPKLMLAAFDAGRKMVGTIYPSALAIKMGTYTFSQTRIRWNPGEKFPRMDSGPGIGAIGVATFCSFINYSFEGAIKHEAAHVLTCGVDSKMRTEVAINNPKDVDQMGLTYFWEIACHNTSDDPYGGGISISVSGRAGCILPYTGPLP